ncbi:MAG: intradiol ring-cleavage dioxygenase [Imperialibacter sp.]|uniref:dioxygenase family protein n=1 Tax=Imperialibacter sp. TaxID=2038411 RepID=UPI0032EC4112
MKSKTFCQVLIATALTMELFSCQGQPNVSGQKQTAKKVIVGGGCDGCELMFVGMPASIDASDTSAGWLEEGQKLLVTGKVFKVDGITPASGVVIYYWQTDNEGFYTPVEGMPAKARRHGHIRGWVKTDESGRYSIYTVRPAPYPERDEPAHIHTSIKEPSIYDEYYIDAFVFDDDPLLTGAKRKELENRGGSGVLRVLVSGDVQIAEHNIILGLNVPNYPDDMNDDRQSGLQVGEDSPSFIPFHAWGPDKGTRTCPVCKYGRYHGILYFVGNKPDWDDIKNWLTFLELESVERGKYLKVYFVYGNEAAYTKEARQKELEDIGRELDLKNIALTFVPSLTDKASEVNLNQINPEEANTFIIYRQRAIVAKFIGLEASTENLKLISTTLDKTKGEYFDLSEPAHN